MTTLFIIGTEPQNIAENSAQVDVFDRIITLKDVDSLIDKIYSDRLAPRLKAFAYETSLSVVCFNGNNISGISPDNLDRILKRFLPALNITVVQSIEFLNDKDFMDSIRNNKVIGNDTILRINHWMYHQHDKPTGDSNDTCYTNLYSLMSHLITSNSFAKNEPIPRIIRNINFREYFNDIYGQYDSDTVMEKHFIDTLSTWNFCAIKFTTKELILCAFFLLRSLSKRANVLISDNKLLLLLITIEASYHQINKFHNFRHAVDVMQATWQICSNLGGNGSIDLSPLTVLLLSMSAIGHDIGHPGTNNQLLCQHESFLATNFDNKSVLENFHNTLFQNLLVDHWPQILKAARYKTVQSGEINVTDIPFVNLKKSNNINENDDNDKKMTINVITNAILATDMAMHAKYVDKLDELLKVPQHLLPLPTLIAVIIKAADISNVTRPLSISARWAFLITLEFNDCSLLDKYASDVKEDGTSSKTACYNSNGKQRVTDPEYYKRNSPEYIVDLVLNREEEDDEKYLKRLLQSYPNIPQGQIFFINTFAGKFFGRLGELFPELQFLSNNVNSNKSYWESMVAKN